MADMTRLPARWNAGEAGAFEEPKALVFGEVRRLQRLTAVAARP